jgi:hypothetical protein
MSSVSDRAYIYMYLGMSVNYSGCLKAVTIPFGDVPC